MISKDLATIIATDIDSLVANQQDESIMLEFKQELPGKDQQARHEFCADVSAMANVQGGDSCTASPRTRKAALLRLSL